MRKRIAKEEALFYEELLKEEISKDRQEHGKKPLKEKEDDFTLPSSGSGDDGAKEPAMIKSSTTEPESGWFRKGKHKLLASSIETACDRNGWILGYTVSPGNLYDSRTFRGLYELLIDDGIKPLNLKKPAKIKQRLGLLEKCFCSRMIKKQILLSFERKSVLRFVS